MRSARVQVDDAGVPASREEEIVDTVVSGLPVRSAGPLVVPCPAGGRAATGKADPFVVPARTQQRWSWST